MALSLCRRVWEGFPVLVGSWILLSSNKTIRLSLKVFESKVPTFLGTLNFN